MKLAKKLRNRVAAGDVMWGTFVVEMKTPAAVMVLANCGLDFFVIDTEHGSFDAEHVSQLIDTGKRTGICPMVRVPGADRGSITRVLDAGAEGILIPMSNSIEDVRRAVEFTKYPPLGKRGIHLLRPHTDFMPVRDVRAFLEQANRTLITAVQIETPGATRLVDEIAATEGVDMLYVGPADLSTSLGHPCEEDHPEVMNAMTRIGNAAQRHGKLAGCHIGRLDGLSARVEMGYRVFGYAAEFRMFLEGVQAFMDRAGKATANALGGAPQKRSFAPEA